jgi:N-acetylglucosamine-6-phosphate deacetylase
MPVTLSMATHSVDQPVLSTAASRWTQVLTSDGVLRAELTLDGGVWTEWSVDTSVVNPALAAREGYVVPVLPVEFHCHGLRGMDFSDFQSLELTSADRAAREEGVLCVLTMFLPSDALNEFDGFMRAFAQYQSAHPGSHLAGVALEGPLLASVGGTPQTGSWVPSSDDWRRIAACGEYGLKYVVLSPDAHIEGSHFAAAARLGPSIQSIVDVLLRGGVTPALGHFQRSNPQASAAAIVSVIEVARRHQRAVLTDHLFNDMPLNFRHAWRTADEKAQRDGPRLSRELDAWTTHNLTRMLGPVPATLITAACKGDAVLCVNFDGDHVDHEVCKRLQVLVESDRMIAMTDRVETSRLGGSELVRSSQNSLWYQADGSAVAAGSISIDRAMSHLRALGTPEYAIWRMAGFVSHQVLGLPVPQPCDVPGEAGVSWVDAGGQRGWLPRRADSRGHLAQQGDGGSSESGQGSDTTTNHDPVLEYDE